MKNKEPYPEDLEKVRAWRKAMFNVRKIEKELIEARAVEHKAEEELAKWILPDEPLKDCENVCLWFGDTLISATMYKRNFSDLNSYSVCIRHIGESINKIDMEVK